METSQRATIGATWGGDDWGIHVSTDVNYNLGDETEVPVNLYEAYASTNVMGYANVTVGREALIPLKEGYLNLVLQHFFFLLFYFGLIIILD